MKKILLICSMFLVIQSVTAQITSAIIKANFGVDADLRANYFNGFVQAGNDDWFNNGTAGMGQFIIDTTGAAAIVSGYSTNIASRRQPFYRGMRFAPYSVVNNRLLIDAVFIRDYHGDDSTIFAAGSNKNGMSPATWTCPVSHAIPDKNDILDMMVHVRRAGPNTTDSLWMFGGLSIENVVGNRYFDFEMYQTDIYYDRATRRFYNYGAEDGHTAWLFDASGNITRPGDIVFTAEYGSSSLTMLEARIWVNRASLSMTPTSFTWTGSFDGASTGAQYGYAGIIPKTLGAFYTGLQSVSASTWGGPFSVVLGNNVVTTTYIARQFMEFSVNLTKLGLDPVTLLGGSACGMPFRRILVKTRSATSFTAELKDFVGPFDLFLPARAAASADLPWLCGSTGISTITIENPVSTSVYNWTTADGNIIGTTTGTSITVDRPGSYIVTQQLQSGCSDYAKDTVVIGYSSSCGILDKSELNFTGAYENGKAQLNWISNTNSLMRSYQLERSADGIHFSPIKNISSYTDKTIASYTSVDDLKNFRSSTAYYRLKITDVNNATIYSTIVRLVIPRNELYLSVAPNPTKEKINLQIQAPDNANLQVFVYDISGRLMYSKQTAIIKGVSNINIPGAEKWPAGVYTITAKSSFETRHERVVISK